MARQTRSTATQEKEKDIVPPAVHIKTATKKRKRNSIPDVIDEPAAKQLRTEEVPIKEEPTRDSSNDNMIQKDSTLPQLQNAGDIPIDPGDAQKILDILEMVDTQGLLDRVFPLPANSSLSSFNSAQGSYSFRNLLKESSQHPLCILRSAIERLLPISSHPRSRPSKPAAQQLRFCNLALSLLDQASFNSVSIPLDLETLLHSDSTSSPEDDAKLLPSSSSHRKRKYALKQQLATGDYWTSLNSDFSLSSIDGREIKDLHTAHAELVAVLPSPSNSLSFSLEGIPTLGSYNPKKLPGPKHTFLPPRRVSCGTFLDYGVFSSFAPTFDLDGKEVGRTQLGEVIWGWEERKKERDKGRRGLSVVSGAAGVAESHDVIVSADGADVVEVTINGKEDINPEEMLEGLLPLDEVANIKLALGSLELENAVHELLERNKKALRRLEELQYSRLMKEGGELSQAEEGSEEWDTAQGILDSLTILASLRPRSSHSASDTAHIIPPPSVLRKLHRTLPLAPSQGWHGTLPPAQTTALRDDSTLKVKSNITPVVPVPPTNTGTPVTAAAVTTPTPTGYSAYPYSGFTSQYRPNAYATYKPGQAPTYYPATYSTTQQTSAPIAQSVTQNYYGSQSYAAGATTGQQPYTIQSWFGYPGTAATATASTSSGRGTPQPVVTSTAAASTSYGSFFNSTTPQQQRTVAVANTVVNKMQTPQGQWSTGYGQVAPTLPPHLRNTYYGTYQQPPR